MVARARRIRASLARVPGRVGQGSTWLMVVLPETCARGCARPRPGCKRDGTTAGKLVHGPRGRLGRRGVLALAGRRGCGAQRPGVVLDAVDAHDERVDPERRKPEPEVEQDVVVAPAARDLEVAVELRHDLLAV